MKACPRARYDVGDKGEVDLRVGASRPLDGYSWRSAPTIVRDVIVVGSIVTDINNAQMASHMESPPGDVRGYDVRTGKQLWTFHTIPQPGEFGNDTWLKDSWAYTGHANVWGAMSADEDLGYVYLPLTTCAASRSSAADLIIVAYYSRPHYNAGNSREGARK